MARTKVLKSQSEIESRRGARLSGSNNITSVSGASQYISAVSFHGYDYNGSQWPSSSSITARNNVRSSAQALGVPTGMTEICCKIDDVGATWRGQYLQGLDLVHDMYLNMTEADVSYWEQLQSSGPCSTTACVAGSDGNENQINMASDLSAYYIQPATWVERQFMHWIRPGMVRVDATCSGCGTGGPGGSLSVKPLAWKRPNGTIVVNLINDSSAQITVNVSGLPSGTYNLSELDPTMCTTSGGKNRCTPVVTTATPSGGSLSLTIPAAGVGTVSQQPPIPGGLVIPNCRHLCLSS